MSTTQFYVHISFLLFLGSFSAASAQQVPVVRSDKQTATLDTAFRYQIVATNNPTAFAVVGLPQGFSVDAYGVISGTPTKAGVFSATMVAINQQGQGAATLDLTLKAPGTAGVVNRERELFITDKNILLRNGKEGPNDNWSFRSLMARIAPKGADLNAFATAWFDTWSQDIPDKREQTTQSLKDAWTGKDGAGFKLIGLVNRMDLGKFIGGDFARPVALGESRLIYELVDGNENSQRFTIIFEFGLLGGVNPSRDTTDWALRWHALGRTSLQGPAHEDDYVNELDQLVMDYSLGSNVATKSRLNQIRTNEFIQNPWQLREFHLSPDGSRIDLAQVALTPDQAKSGSAELIEYLNRNESKLIAGELPLPLDSQVLDGLKSDETTPWEANGVKDRPRFIFAFNTCSGCHLTAVPGMSFQHLGANAPDGSPFIKGEVTLEQPLPGKISNKHHEMAERATILGILAQDPPLKVMSTAELTELVASRRGRVH